MKKWIYGIICLCVALCLAFCGAAEKADPAADLPEGVVPVTWEVSSEHLLIDTPEARELYDRIAAEDYPTMEELKAHPVVAQLDALAAYYQAIYGNTAEIQTEERDEIRDQILDWFLSLGSARTESVNEQGKHSYTYDGPLARNYQAEIVIGLPASGKSTRIADPDSEAMQAFILDPDVIKGALPEYVESHGAAADAVHKEGSMMLTEAMQEFLDGEMKGINVIIPTIGDSLQKLMEKYVEPFEKAGYNVKVRICRAKENEAAARVVKRELSGGQLINSTVAFNFGDGPDNVYKEISTMINSKGETYGYEEDLQQEEEEEQPAA